MFFPFRISFKGWRFCSHHFIWIFGEFNFLYLHFCKISINADAGKSTTGGQLLLLSGQVDDRTIQKYEKEAKDKNRDSWYVVYHAFLLLFVYGSQPLCYK